MERATSKLQQELDMTTSWSTSLKMELLAPKPECSFFTTNTHGARTRPAPCLSRQQIKYHPNPMFLESTYDRLLTFRLHSSIVGSKMKQMAGTLRCLASTDWGYEKSFLRSTYIATDRSTVKYAAAALLPWVSI